MLCLHTEYKIIVNLKMIIADSVITINISFNQKQTFNRNKINV